MVDTEGFVSQPIEFQVAFVVIERLIQLFQEGDIRSFREPAFFLQQREDAYRSRLDQIDAALIIGKDNPIPFDSLFLVFLLFLFEYIYLCDAVSRDMNSDDKIKGYVR